MALKEILNAIEASYEYGTWRRLRMVVWLAHLNSRRPMRNLSSLQRLCENADAAECMVLVVHSHELPSGGELQRAVERDGRRGEGCRRLRRGRPRWRLLLKAPGEGGQRDELLLAAAHGSPTKASS